MKRTSYSADICICKAERIFTYKNTPVLSFSVCYPEVALRRNPAAQGNINRAIQKQVNEFYRCASNDLYRRAVSDYEDSLKTGFPFRRYEAVLNYTATYNQNGLLSLYRDRYIYTGGAHGDTVRASDTWSLKSGEKLPLSGFFTAVPDYRRFLIDEITRQADERMREDPGIFFENYRELINEYFDEESYYLTDSGVAIYYQQYEIAPYSTGIVVFTVPSAPA